MDQRLTRPDGSVLRYRVEGRANAPWLVLSNSLATDLHLWDAQVAALSGEYRLLRYDTRGHGLSRAATPHASLADLADDLLAVMDAAGVNQPAAIAGISLGGMTALELGLRAPQRVSRVLACNCRSNQTDETRAGWDGRIVAMRSKGMPSLVEPTLARWFTPEFRARAGAGVLARISTMIAQTTPDGYAAAVGAIRGLDLLPRLPKMQRPVRLLAGAQDGAASVADMQAIADAVPQAKLTVLDPCSHLSNVEREADFLVWLRAALVD